MSDDAKGASKSLNRTITELSDYMANFDADIDSALRSHMYARIAEIARWWAEEGFKVGVKETLKTLGIEKISVDNIRHEYGDAWLAPGTIQSLELAWPKRNHRRNRTK